MTQKATFNLNPIPTQFSLSNSNDEFYWNFEDQIYDQIPYITMDLTYHESCHGYAIQTKTVERAVMPYNMHACMHAETSSPVI